MSSICSTRRLGRRQRETERALWPFSKLARDEITDFFLLVLDGAAKTNYWNKKLAPKKTKYDIFSPFLFLVLFFFLFCKFCLFTRFVSFIFVFYVFRAAESSLRSHGGGGQRMVHYSQPPSDVKKKKHDTRFKSLGWHVQIKAAGLPCSFFFFCILWAEKSAVLNDVHLVSQSIYFCVLFFVFAESKLVLFICFDETTTKKARSGCRQKYAKWRGNQAEIAREEGDQPLAPTKLKLNSVFRFQIRPREPRASIDHFFFKGIELTRV